MPLEFYFLNLETQFECFALDIFYSSAFPEYYYSIISNLEIMKHNSYLHEITSYPVQKVEVIGYLFNTNSRFRK